MVFAMSIGLGYLRRIFVDLTKLDQQVPTSMTVIPPQETKKVSLTSGEISSEGPIENYRWAHAAGYIDKLNNVSFHASKPSDLCERNFATVSRLSDREQRGAQQLRNAAASEAYTEKRIAQSIQMATTNKIHVAVSNSYRVKISWSLFFRITTEIRDAR